MSCISSGDWSYIVSARRRVHTRNTIHPFIRYSERPVKVERDDK